MTCPSCPHPQSDHGVAGCRICRCGHSGPKTIPAPPPAGAPEHEFEQHEDADARISGVWDEITPPEKSRSREPEIHKPSRMPKQTSRPRRDDAAAFRSMCFRVRGT